MAQSMKKFIALILCAGMLLLLSACRESPTLEETVYTYQAPEVDEEEQELDPEDQGEEDEEFDNETRDDAETERTDEELQGLEGEDNTASSGAASDYNQNSGNDWQAQNAPTETSQQETASSGETQAEASPDYTGGNESATKTVVDATGKEITLPSNVKTVTAVGAAAQMVEMTGGSGRLLAADSDLLSSPLARAAFADIGKISVWWEGDGTAPISDANFSALLAAHPDVCFELSGQNTFTSAQTDALTQAGICYIVLPALSSRTSLKQALAIVAQCMTVSSGGKDSAAIAAAYSSWVDSCVSTAGKKTASDLFSGLYLTGWDGSASYQLNNTYGALDTSGTGLATAFSGTKAQLISTFMKAAGVTNESTAYNLYQLSDYVYVTPMFHQFDPTVTGTEASYYDGNGAAGIPISRDLFTYSVDNEISLGENEYFPVLIVADEATKKAVEENWFWQFHPECVVEGGYRVGGSNFYAGILGEYDIYVNPSGMLSWESSVESPLEALWVASIYSDGGYSLNEVKAATNSFYQQFFGISLTGDQLKDIYGE